MYAIDADRQSILRLRENIALNAVTNIMAIHSGVAPTREVLPFGVNLRVETGARARFADPIRKRRTFPAIRFLTS